MVLLKPLQNILWIFVISRPFRPSLRMKWILQNITHANTYTSCEMIAFSDFSITNTDQIKEIFFLNQRIRWLSRHRHTHTHQTKNGSQSIPLNSHYTEHFQSRKIHCSGRFIFRRERHREQCHAFTSFIQCETLS